MQIKHDKYSQYLLTAPYSYTNTHMADHIEKLSHDRVNRFLKREELIQVAASPRLSVKF